MAKKKNRKIPLSNILVGIMLILQLVTGAVILHLHNETRVELEITRETNRVSQDPVSTFGFEQPQVQANEKRIYFPRLGLWIPMTTQTADLVYRVTDELGGGITDATFTTRSNLEIYQFGGSTQDSCEQLVRIEIGADKAQPGIGEVVLPVIQLNNETDAYTYYYNEGKSLCKLFVHTPQEVAELLQELKSY